MISLLLPAVDIPDGCTVKKRQGCKEYTLRKRLPLWNLPTDVHKTIVDAISTDYVFLVSSEGGGVTCYKNDKEFKIELEHDEAIRLITRLKAEHDYE